MAMSRALGGRLFTTRSPIRISLEVMFSSPAIMRIRVDLPQPDGPTRTTNSPSVIMTLTPWITSVAPKAFLTSRTATDAITCPLRSAQRPLVGNDLAIIRQAADGNKLDLPAQLGQCV